MINKTSCNCLWMKSVSVNRPSLFSADLTSVTLGGSRPLRPAADLHEHIRQLVWWDASGAFADETGSRSVQRPGVHPAQEVQRHRETLMRLQPLSLRTGLNNSTRRAPEPRRILQVGAVGDGESVVLEIAGRNRECVPW